MAGSKEHEGWRKRLSPEQYKVLREKGTEPAFSGALLKNKKDGIYKCAACGQELFSSSVKYESHSGWPSFWEAVEGSKIGLADDNTNGLHRTEVVCGNCGSHLGHLFDDGPQPTGKRYCINSLALDFTEKPKQK